MTPAIQTLLDKYIEEAAAFLLNGDGSTGLDESEKARIRAFTLGVIDLCAAEQKRVFIISQPSELWTHGFKKSRDTIVDGITGKILKLGEENDCSDLKAQLCSELEKAVTKGKVLGTRNRAELAKKPKAPLGVGETPECVVPMASGGPVTVTKSDKPVSPEQIGAMSSFFDKWLAKLRGPQTRGDKQRSAIMSASMAQSIAATTAKETIVADDPSLAALAEQAAEATRKLHEAMKARWGRSD